jgi:hypothetical protein
MPEGGGFRYASGVRISIARRQWLVLAALCGCLVPAAAAGQAPADIPDLIRALRHQPPSSNQSPSEVKTSILPTISSNPAIGVSVGALMSRAVRRGGAGSRMSTVHASVAFTTESQIIGAVRNELHSRNDRWALIGDSRLAKFQQAAPPLGSDVQESSPVIAVKYNWIRLYQTAYRQLRGPFHLGLGYHLDSFMDMTPKDEGGELPPEVAGVYPATAVASGVSLDALFDSRDNPLNASRGFYGRASYYYNPVFLGSDSDWQSAQFDGRAYLKLPSARRQILAAWTQAWLRLDGRPPYLSLPSPGWDTYGRSGRGYAAGKLRGRDWIYGETEYRVDLMASGLVGMVAFVNASTLSDAEGHYGAWAVGAGTGMRVKLNKRDGTNIAMDVAWGRGGKVGVWFGLNEVF